MTSDKAVDFSRFKAAFNIFASKSVILCSKDDYDDYANTYTVNEIGTLRGDMQSYSAELSEKEYGLRVDCEKRFFVHSELPEFEEGAQLYIIDGVRSFRVMHIAGYDMGAVMLLKEAEPNGGR